MMPSALDRILAIIRRKRAMSDASADKLRREACDFALQLLNTYALSTAHQPGQSPQRFS